MAASVDNEHYPEAVSWFSVNVGKEKLRKETNFDIAEYLQEEEVQKLIETRTYNSFPVMML
jgi:hypothetical protein